MRFSAPAGSAAAALGCYGDEGSRPTPPCYPCNPWSIPFRGEGSDNFFETRIAAQRIPKRQQFQFAVTEIAWPSDRDRELFAGKIFVANPCSDNRQIFHHDGAIDSIFFQRQKLARAPALAQRFLFPSKASVDQTKHTQCQAVVWLSFNDFLLLRSRRSESEPRFRVIFCHPSDKTFGKATTESYRIDTKTTFAQRRQGIGSGREVALCQCAR